MSPSNFFIKFTLDVLYKRIYHELCRSYRAFFSKGGKLEIIFTFKRSFDPNNTGKISEHRFMKIMKSKENVAEEDINEMIAGTLILIFFC